MAVSAKPAASSIMWCPKCLRLSAATPNSLVVRKGALAKMSAKTKRMYMDAVMVGFLFGHCRRRCRLNCIAERHILTKTAASDTAAVAAAYSVFSNALAHQSIMVCGIMPHSTNSSALMLKRNFAALLPPAAGRARPDSSKYMTLTTRR